MGLFGRLFGKRDSGGDDEFRALIEQSMEELRLKTGAHDSLWHLGESDWSVDQTEGTIVFTTPKDTTVTCPVQIIGTYNTADGTWLWGWDHPSVQPPLQEHAKRLREYGEKHHIASLTTRKLKCSEGEAWEFTALACNLCDAQGAYRGPTGPTRVFMTFGEVSMSATEPEPEGPETPKQELQRLLRTGIVRQVFLHPLEWGGVDGPPNITWLTDNAIRQKEEFEAQVAAEVEKGASLQYNANLEYKGESQVPARLLLAATGPNVDLRKTIEVEW